MRIMLKRIILTGSTLRSRPADEKARLAAAVEATVWPWVTSGAVKAQVEATLPLAEAAAAEAAAAEEAARQAAAAEAAAAEEAALAEAQASIEADKASDAEAGAPEGDK